MSDVSSSTPSLTPQSTGTQDSSSPRAPSKKPRPQAAVYPNVNAANKEQKPFSRSAAKRGSVMALGSIEHLQHYFTKTGLIAKKEYVRGFYISQYSLNQNSGPTRRERASSLQLEASMPTSRRSHHSVTFQNSTSLHHPHFPRHHSLHSRLMSRLSRLTLRISGLG